MMIRMEWSLDTGTIDWATREVADVTEATVRACISRTWPTLSGVTVAVSRDGEPVGTGYYDV